ncbi:hypothetical protein [Sphingomonas sp. PAMC 26621]|uniref:hypothetical protein n=1 Tax=Sphingomonas sp. PAMC 26621 TaxID=1112213 RepID=UPI000289C7DB|nr:hypothetical protein [Sphingomonas sp. PAMC 26621]
MNVGLRLKDELVAEVDRIAASNGQTRSSWIANAIARAVVSPSNDDLPNLPLEGRGHPDDLIRVTIRLHRSEIEGIETVGACLGLSRNEWIKRTIRWQLWDKAAVLRLAPATASELGKARKLVMKMSDNVNQAVHAMNAANMPGSSLDIARIAGSFIEMCGDFKAKLFEARRSFSSSVGAEVGYWTSNHEGREG